jgi:hypothetical protein
MAIATIFEAVEVSVSCPIKGGRSKSPFDVMVVLHGRQLTVERALHGYLLPKCTKYTQEKYSVHIDVLS